MSSEYRALLKKLKLTGPLAFVDLHKFDRNAKKMADLVRPSGLHIRVATKSLRVPELIQRVLNSDPIYRGLMCFSAQEALFLSEQGFNDFLIAYPTVCPQDLSALKKIHDQGKEVYLVVDSIAHLEALSSIFQNSSRPFRVLFEVDLSLRLGPLVVGVRRSPLRTTEQVLELVRHIQSISSLKFSGFMAYEAQVAGVGDRNPFKPLLSKLLKPLRHFSAKKIAQKREQLKSRILAEFPQTEFLFNGGGTGSLSFNLPENQTLTELTAGSGFYCPHLFDYYSNFNLEAAAFFALQVVRQPEPHWFTCLGGGFIASGEPNWDRIPRPEANMKLSGFEAAGEVQTPVYSRTENLAIGDSVIFRHAKAGELMERFNDVVLIQDGKVTANAKTYRGFGQCYF
ncbi:alanine racemase [Pseudobdellovibrio exovorus]|uniref:Alanine racemase N-terminal domain-containing protein n=1 Tax=Pseudobdellovibrio exovorus JSS TaxID=1184267 RepID=M4VB15_9BACT|nr:alanine racemase [Pseudobdellovibrio exovorus]AGH96408.1 hypothetical protein A11Q_2192 [Pseudobdellovibrio exovorus JSS]